MKLPAKSHYLIAALLALIISLSPTLQAQNKGKIPWSTSRMLVWKDFKGNAIANHPAHALTSYEIKFASSYNKETGKVEFEVECLFVEKNSWVKPDPTDHLLKHEQGHFDIAEIYARKLRKKLAETDFNLETIEEDVGAIYQDLMQQSHDFQEEYDHETDHSKNKELQWRWNKIIARQLRELEPYARVN